MLSATPVHARSVTLAWDPPNNVSDLAGYRVYWGTTSRGSDDSFEYDESEFAGNRHSWTVDGLDDDVTYYFAVTSVDTQGQESAYSNEVQCTASGEPEESDDQGEGSSGSGSGDIQLQVQNDPSLDLLVYQDFVQDTTDDFLVFDTWTEGGRGELLYDSTEEKMQVLTGDNIGLQFSCDLPAMSTGIFSMDFYPIVKYPAGGIITVFLKQDEFNYYEIGNTDGYGPGTVKKIVNGKVVASAKFHDEYHQGDYYHFMIRFSPEKTDVSAFGQTISLTDNGSVISVTTLEVGTRQQDAYFDNIAYAGHSGGSSDRDDSPLKTLLFYDDCSSDTSGDYDVYDTWTKGGTGEFFHDSLEGKLQVITGDNIALKFAKRLSPLTSGVFSIDFHPLVHYPAGGILRIHLIQDINNFYAIEATDGYGPGTIKKIVNGKVVDTAVIQEEYRQNGKYSIAVQFSPELTSVSGLSRSPAAMNADNSIITVKRMEVVSIQQDACFDNIILQTTGR